jgi:hypothetical protein
MFLFSCLTAESPVVTVCTRWFKYYRDYLCVNKSQFVPVIFEPPCTISLNIQELSNLSTEWFPMSASRRQRDDCLKQH